ncbi:hypothetical protein MACJ_001043 [Theileria orientalis]|uniref:Ribosomal RNA-processing protein 4 n=1 Tax=Theileria orientalis TaxID=68886 RepID=A0A976M7U9_THEOR|nr:hypothetical protein MACJ_001043 [Theileria orientalis]
MGDSHLVLPGDVVSSDASYLLQGHGTHVTRNELKATYSGLVKHVNQLVYVEPFSGKYMGQIGDIVIGIVENIQGNKWFLDVNSVERAHLSILQVNTQELANRRKIDEDIYEMSNLFRVKDIISSEVQRISPSGTIILQTRTSKYGKLDNGILVVVRPNLVMRQVKHIYDMECGVRVIMGCNGYIWLTTWRTSDRDKTLSIGSFSPSAKTDLIKKVCIVRNILLMFSSNLIKLNFDLINRAFSIYSRLFPGKYNIDKLMERSLLSHLRA